MNFALITQIDDEGILTYELMQRGVLARSRRCKNRNKHEYDVDMELSNNQKRWRCHECTNTYSVRKDSFFENSNVKLLIWVQVIAFWSQENTIRAIANNVDVSQPTVSEMVKGLREQCQAFLEDQPPLIGGPGNPVEIKILKRCTAECDIVIVKQSDRDHGYLLHNKNGRYNNPESGKVVPVQPGGTVFTRHGFNLPENVATSDDLVLYQGNANPERHAKDWIRKRHGIPCNKAGGFLGEYNFRFLYENDQDEIGERFIAALSRHYQGEFL
ncbi:uncharacterized protein [Clytia hemisphaerica]|uniref:uncharacterized protein n=1 Tax=Clytia hemisphaerica TaxID=252671 RepID=UPI0034D395F4